MVGTESRGYSNSVPLSRGASGWGCFLAAVPDLVFTQIAETQNIPNICYSLASNLPFWKLWLMYNCSEVSLYQRKSNKIPDFFR